MTLPILAMHVTDRCRCTLGYFLSDCLNSIGFCVIDIIPSVTSHNECKKTTYLIRLLLLYQMQCAVGLCYLLMYFCHNLLGIYSKPLKYFTYIWMSLTSSFGPQNHPHISKSVLSFCCMMGFSRPKQPPKSVSVL